MEAFAPRRPVQRVIAVIGRRGHEDDVLPIAGMKSASPTIQIDELNGSRHLCLIDIPLVGRTHCVCHTRGVNGAAGVRVVLGNVVGTLSGFSSPALSMLKYDKDRLVQSWMAVTK
jgi:hypothetical protein